MGKTTIIFPQILCQMLGAVVCILGTKKFKISGCKILLSLSAEMWMDTLLNLSIDFYIYMK